ncbi:MAG: Hydrolase MutT1, partial [uncultured Solirubrobacterales bacterium]
GSGLRRGEGRGLRRAPPRRRRRGGRARAPPPLRRLVAAQGQARRRRVLGGCRGARGRGGDGHARRPRRGARARLLPGPQGPLEGRPLLADGGRRGRRLRAQRRGRRGALGGSARRPRAALLRLRPRHPDPRAGADRPV